MKRNKEKFDLEAIDKLIEEEHKKNLKLKEEAKKDGESVQSTLDLPVYVVPKQSSHCHHCIRPQIYFEGCSIIECPMRRRITAQQSYTPKSENYEIED